MSRPLVSDRHPISATDLEAIEKFIRNNKIDFVVIGPEDPLALGLADRLRTGQLGRRADRLVLFRAAGLVPAGVSDPDRGRVLDPGPGRCAGQRHLALTRTCR